MVGSHLGGHIAALALALSAAGSRSGSWSSGPGTSRRRWTAGSTATSPYPQSGFFLRRELPPGRRGRADRSAPGSALRDGLAVYLTGDIPWDGPNTRPGRLLGQPAAVPLGLGRPGRPDPRPGLPRLLHPPPRRPVRPDDRARPGPSPRATRPPPSPATSTASNARSPPTRPTPSPTCSGPATALPRPPRRPAPPPAAPPGPAVAWPPSPDLSRAGRDILFPVFLAG